MSLHNRCRKPILEVLTPKPRSFVAERAEHLPNIVVSDHLFQRKSFTRNANATSLIKKRWGSVSINPSVQSANDLTNPNLQDIADAEKSRDGNRATCLDLLPMARRETKGNHVFLAVLLPSAQLPNALAECLEEFGVIYHAAICTGARAEVPRAD
jgi:hypothetical protein